ncbi:glucokinase [Sodalis ligni]|uniref:Glucokinase n=1 Tax=Sodalis ligni TaxID=2697027 RepID=A0A4R1N9F2_9GAMM|nr:glucokinase [Sodalis ligni]TCL02151.1 glucokinase [Sodalis ligni]
MTQFALVGDIGGTNARLCLCDIHTGELTQIQSFPGADFPSLESVIRHYLDTQRCRVHCGCIAIACPVSDDNVTMTNHNWHFSIREIKASLGFENFQVINDFTAVSLAVPMLSEKDIIKVGGKDPVKNMPIVVYGAGTGLGVSHIIHVDERWISLPGEGGHVDFAPDNEEEDYILSELRKEFGHVSAERLLSGPGLVNIYKAIVRHEGGIPERLTPQDVSDRAMKEGCGYCRRALTIFCAILGRFGGNLALSIAAFGGVYIAGGIVPRFLDFFLHSAFRKNFESKGRFMDYLRDVPVFLIRHPYPGLLGAGSYIRQSLGQIIE